MADMGIIAKGNTLEEVFKECAKGLMNLMVDISKVDKKIIKTIQLKNNDLYSLLYDFLTELLIIVDSENIVFSDFDIKITKKENEYYLIAKCYGEPLNKNKHEIKEEVKAITYHKMEIKKENKEDGYIIKVIVDL